MIVAIHQPNYLPYLGFFHKMLLADCLVLHDTVQFSRDDYHNRNRFKTPQGPIWLTVPVRRPGMQEIRDVMIDQSRRWSDRHWKTIHANLSRAPHFAGVGDDLRRVYGGEWERLALLNERLISALAKGLGIDTPVVRASDLDVPKGLTPSNKLVAITKIVGGTAYLSGVGGLNYVDPLAFSDLDLLVQEFHHPVYPQLWGDFLPNLSAVDMICNVGREAGGMLRASGTAKPWPR